MDYMRSPPDWEPSDPNPFSADGRYGSQWTCFRIACAPGCLSGGGRRGPFTIVVPMDCPDLKARLADFLRYESRNGRRVILSCPESVDIDALIREALVETPEGDTVRPTDPKWVVHSTTLEAWDGISTAGSLKSLSLLREDGIQTTALGQTELGEPAEYADYVILGQMHALSAEYVVASGEEGRIVTEPDRPYDPGIRLYFDNHRIVRDGLAIRDGLHTSKVYRHLPLKPFMVASVRAEEFPPRAWTPRTFVEAANELFFRKIEGR